VFFLVVMGSSKSSSFVSFSRLFNSGFLGLGSYSGGRG